MDMADVYKFVKSETLAISSDSPIPNAYKPLSESKQIKTEIPCVSGKDVLQEHSYSFIVETEPADSTLSEGGHMVLHDLTGHRRHVKTNESTDLLESHRTLIPDVKETIESVPAINAVEEKAFVCDICEEKFPRKSILTQHMRSHSGEKPFVCNICDKRYSYLANLTRHKLSCQTGGNPLVCDICDKRYSYLANLTRHKLSCHTGGNPLVCDICDKRYSYLANLTRHKLSCHTGGSPLVCEFCGKLFSLPCRLAEHRRFHTGETKFVCDFCGKEFAHAFNLKQHKQIHTGEKPCVCEFCGKGFTQACNLAQHKRIHTGEKPFACDLCDKRFSYTSSLREHQRSHAEQHAGLRLLWSDLKSHAKQTNPYVRKTYYKPIAAKYNACVDRLWESS